MPLKPELKRDQTIIFRLSRSEREQVEEAAKGARSVSDWLRAVVLSHAAQVPAAVEGAAKGREKGDD